MYATFPPDVAEFMHDSVAAGVYASEADLLIEAVRQLRDGRDNYLRFQTQFRQRLEQLDRGEGISLEGDAQLEQFLRDIESEVIEEMAAKKT